MKTIEGFKTSIKSIPGEIGCPYITWKEIEQVLGKELNKQFNKFMNGQTSFIEGAYLCDVENFLRKSQNRFFD